MFFPVPLVLSALLVSSTAAAVVDGKAFKVGVKGKPFDTGVKGKPFNAVVKGKAFDRFVTIWLENTDYDLAAGDPNLKWLATKGITLSNHFAVTHPSMPNYAAAIAGDYFGINHDDLIAIPSNVSTVVDLLEEKNISWGEYQEDMPYTGFEGKEYRNQNTGANDYVRKHNPAVLYDSVADSTDRLSKIKNLTLFYSDLEKDQLPQWMFITPNMTSDGHDSSVTVAGTWTRAFLEPLLTNKKFMKNTLVLVTFDENHTYAKQNRIVGILLGDAVETSLQGTTDATFYNHYSEIATVQANWGLNTLGRWDVGANVFKFVAEKTRDNIRTWTGKVALEQMFFNLSYAGPFNNKNSSVPWPVPNSNAVHAGRAVSPVVRNLWGSRVGDTAYTTALEVPDGLHPEGEFKH